MNSSALCKATNNAMVSDSFKTVLYLQKKEIGKCTLTKLLIAFSSFPMK